MNIVQIIGDLYRADIDCGLESYRGNGVTAWVVDENNHRIEKTFEMDELERIAAWLLAQASDRYGICEQRQGAASPHDLLAGLARSERKGLKRVERQEGHRRTTQHADGTTS